MRILWFVNAVFPDLARILQLSGQHKAWWLNTLAERLSVHPAVSLGVATAISGGAEVRTTAGNIEYFGLPHPQLASVQQRLGVGGWHRIVPRCARVIEAFQPDVVVVHGTEFGYGLVRKASHRPIVVALQGILNAYHPHFWGDLHGSVTRLRYPRAVRDWLSERRRLAMEREIIRINRVFSGRTLWDRSQVFRWNPHAVYQSEPRIVREEFFRRTWRPDGAVRFTIYTTTTPHFRKGTGSLLQAVALLKRTTPNIRLLIGGPIPSVGVGGYLHRTIRALGLGDSVEFLGYMAADQIAERLSQAHVFVLPSYIENSPNSLAEAQAVGTPSIAASVGGVPSMVEPGVSGLLFNVGDPAVLAMSIHQVFESDALASRLSDGARAVAGARNDADAVVEAHLSVCRTALRVWRDQEPRHT